MFDCGDNSCRFAKNKTGMRTNGGCRCFDNPVVKAKITMIVNAFSDGDLINIKTATPQKLLQNDSVRELVEALRFYTDRYNFHIDVGDYRTSSFIEELPDNINDSSAFGTQAHKALKKFEVN